MYKSSNNQVKNQAERGYFNREIKSDRDYFFIVYNSDIYNSYEFSDHYSHSFRPSSFPIIKI